MINTDPDNPDHVVVMVLDSTEYSLPHGSVGKNVIIFGAHMSSPTAMQRHSDVSFTSHISRDVADHAETSSPCRDWYVNETDLLETSL